MSSTDAAGSNQIVDGSVTEQKIRDAAIKTSHIQTGAITATKISAGAIVAAGLGAGSVTSANILNGTISDSDNDLYQPHYCKFLYDFSVHGGAVSAITLTADDGTSALTIPAYSTIINATYRIITTITGGAGATLALGFTGTANGFLTAGVVSGLVAAPSAASSLPAFAAPVVVGSTAVSVLGTVAVNALTAGKLVVWVSYLPGTATL